MATWWLRLLLAGSFSILIGAAPGHKLLSYEDLVFKDEKGETVLDLSSGTVRSLQAKHVDCESKAEDGKLVDCKVLSNGINLRVIEDDDCFEIKNGVNIGEPGGIITVPFDLKEANWYGGGEEIPQKWPLEKYENLDHSMVTQQAGNRAVQDPIWINSEGLLIFVKPGAPLFMKIDGKQLILTTNLDNPYRSRPQGYTFSYMLCKAKNPKDAFLLAIQKGWIKKPTGYPDERMIKYPVWSTWAKYKADISDEIVRDFAKQIKDHGFENSQLEIDDAWETCYGSKEVNTTRFPDMKKLTNDLKKDGFRVTIWTHPFINLDCTDTLKEADSNGYLVKNATGFKTYWWNGNGAHIDFTKTAAQNWFIKRHEDLLSKYGIDGFKFDAGETSWMPDMPILNIAEALDEDYPNLATKLYVETCAKFNNLTEVRSAYRSQELPIFLRMVDKDSRWTDENGLKSLVTTLLQLNMVGYSLVLPDMIGGNQYNEERATPELFIRWLQANTFMPALQYAILPWDFDDEGKTTTLSKKFNDLHVKYAPIIIQAMKRNVQDGTPVNPPIWWIDPTDPTALAEDSEFMLGEDLIAAPVLEKGETKRRVYLPKGDWRDGNSKQVHKGPITLTDYDAPLDVLPYFTRVGSNADKIENAGRSLTASFTFVILSVASLLLYTL